MKVEKFLVLLGLPRSGTTMATAMFDVHPDIAAWFEPWHARQKQVPQPYQSVEDFVKQYKEQFNTELSDKKNLMLKETSTHIEAINWSEESIENIKKSNPDIDVKVIWLIRDINHAYLSRVHTARKHWGHPDMKIDTDSFKEFVNFAYKGFKEIENVVGKYNSCMLSYEKLVTNPKETMQKVMEFLGLELHPNQLEYYKHFKIHKSAGDPEVSSSPKPIDPKKIEARDKEWSEYKDVFLNALDDNQRQKYNYMQKIVVDVRNLGFKKY